MKEFFIDMWGIMTEPIDGWVDGIMRVLLWAVIALIILLVLYGIFYVVDSSFRTKMEGEGVVVNKKFTPAYTTFSYVQSGKTTIPISTYHPDRWTIDISLNDGVDDITVSELYYNSVSVGTKIWVEYVTGRFSGGLYIKEII